jgi:mono/diheme cytochrome c family protein/glucose/arabinose dehydrogenase
MKSKSLALSISIVIVFVFIISSFYSYLPNKIELEENTKISLIGGNLGSRMINYDHFDTEIQLRYPEKKIRIRNLCDGGDTPGFRPHSGRFTPWAFPGAELYQTEFTTNSGSEGHFEYPDQWLSRMETDIIITFFGYSESFNGPTGLLKYKKELQAFIDHTKTQRYNGKNTPQVVMVSPIAFQDLSAKYDLPNAKKENANLLQYMLAMKEVATKNQILFIDAYTPSLQWYKQNKEPLTIDGFQLNEKGYKLLSVFLANQIFGKTTIKNENYREAVYEMVKERNWMWHSDYKIPNGVHVYGRRYNPFGPDNYPAELEKIRQMTDIRDRAIWLAASSGKKMDLIAEDKKTRELPPVVTNFNPDKNGNLSYLYGEDALNSIKVAEGYKLELFASEKEFPDLANPVQMTFDNKGRLWVATMPSYPHYKPGDAKPNDKILILEDLNNDGKADKQTVFLDGLHVPVGFEITHDGVFVSQGTNLMFYKDTNGDDKADYSEIVLSGFDDHDTHHEISAFVTDESGAIYMGEGVFLHTNVETPYGTVRATNGGFYRYNPARKHLERTAQLSIPNPWGIAFDKWGQNFFAETSGPDVRWMMPGTVLNRYGESNHKSDNLIEDAHRVRPTSGLEFISSRHFPDNVQGDMLINNTIGFLGMKQHQIEENGTGYKSKHRKDLVVSDDKNFRPVDMEFAPDGSLYFIDWHNILVGHMQHNARDPLRDHVHGRVYRITYTGKPLLKPAKVFGASVEELLENLKLPEYRTRYRVRRELRGRSAAEVLPKITKWVTTLDKNDEDYEHHLLEALWVSWGLNKVDQVLLKRLLKSKDHKVRAAAVRVLRYTGHQVLDQQALLMQAAKDAHGRVRLEALVAASWLGKAKGLPILAEAKKMPLDNWMEKPYEKAFAHLNGRGVTKSPEVYSTTHIQGKDLELFTLGREIFAKEGYCITCHQPDGKGLTAAGFPPLTGTNWVTGNEDRLIKIVLKGMMGPIEVNGVKYAGQVPMTPYGGLLNDKEIAGVLTYVRNSFGNKASVIQPEKVKMVRASVANKKDLYNSSQLLEEHPLEK